MVALGAAFCFGDHIFSKILEALMAYPATHFSLCMFQIPEKQLGGMVQGLIEETF